MRKFFVLLVASTMLSCGGGDVADDVASPEATPTSSVSTVPSTVTTSAPAATTTAPAQEIADPTTLVPPVDDTVPDRVRSITVGGMGAEYTAPTRCVVDLAVSGRRASIEEASRVAARSGEALTAALRSAGVADADIQTSEFSIYPYYDEYEYREIAGYEVLIGYRVGMPDVEGVGPALASAIGAGGDNVRAWGIRFEADPGPLMEAARAEAWADVETRAASLAALAGEPLGDVLDVHEKVLVTSPQGMYQGGEGDSASFDIPVSPGVAGVTVLLTVTYAIGE